MPQDIAALSMVQTDVGLTAAITADNDGLDVKIADIAFGDGNGAGYQPTREQTGLVNERNRISVVGNGQRVDPHTILLQGMLQGGPEFNCREIGVFSSEGVLMAIWSDPVKPRWSKSDGIPVVCAYTLSFKAVPAESVSWIAGPPSVNFVFDQQFIDISITGIRNELRWIKLYNQQINERAYLAA